jgi:hypothetical protein
MTTDQMCAEASKLFDVLAVDMTTHKIEIMAEKKTKRNADAIEMMAVMRRGVETHFYTSEPSGKHKDGDEWNPVEEL